MWSNESSRLMLVCELYSVLAHSLPSSRKAYPWPCTRRNVCTWVSRDTSENAHFTPLIISNLYQTRIDCNCDNFTQRKTKEL